MGLVGCCTRRLGPAILGSCISLSSSLIFLAPQSHSQSSEAPSVAIQSSADENVSEIDTVHVSSTPRLEVGKNALRVDVNLVMLQVTVTDAMSHAVAGLKKEDFALYEGDSKQEIRYFGEEDGPISVGLILDLSKSMANKVETERAAVEQFFHNANPDDDYFVITVSDRPKLIATSTRSLRTIETELGLAVPDGNTALLDAIYLGMAEMQKAKYQRHALLIISDGGDNRSRYKLREIKSMVRESDVAVYAIGLFDTALFKTFEEFMGKKWLEEITDASGGRTVAVLRNQYVLGYKPPTVAADGEWRKIEMKVMPRENTPPSSQSRLQAYYRRGYLAGR
jgi:Ca-activated chloride channel homolog